MRKLLLLLLFTVVTTMVSAQKYVGGDISLVPAYEDAGDKWLDAEGKVINNKENYSDGFVTFVNDVAKWNSVRIRLMVDPSQDDDKATRQDLQYVKELGKRVKDAGMNFLLDIFYSDTWTDVSQQWIPTSWGHNKSTATATLATKVKSYTTEVINELTANGAKPDFVQIGNEVSYGMLWDNMTGKGTSNAFYLNSSYNSNSAQVKRFATLLKAAAEGVRASEASGAKIILHCERTKEANKSKDFYAWVEQAGFTDYDIIGLSYYPIWHGTLSDLGNTISTLQANFPAKDIHIVETGYNHQTPSSFKEGEWNSSSVWPYTYAGQGQFIQDLIAKLKEYDHVKGLYYWQPEECGNGAKPDATDASGNQVRDALDYRGLWASSWKIGEHAFSGRTAMMALHTFVQDDGPTDVTNQYITNATFDTNIEGWTNTGGTAKWKENNWGAIANCCEFAWTGSAIVNQEVVQSPTLPVGSYKLSVNCASNNGATGVLLIAGDQIKEMVGTGNVETATVEFTVSAEGPVKLGVKLQNTTATWVNFDNFMLLKETTSGIETIDRKPTSVNQHAWYTLDGRKLAGKPSIKGIYIQNGKKMIVR